MGRPLKALEQGNSRRLNMDSNTILGLLLGALLGTLLTDFKDHLKQLLENSKYAWVVNFSWYAALVGTILVVVLGSRQSWRTALGMALGSFLCTGLYVSIVSRFPGSPLGMLRIPVAKLLERTRRNGSESTGALADLLAAQVFVVIIGLVLLAIFNRVTMPVIGFLGTLVVILVICVIATTHLAVEMAHQYRSASAETRLVLYPVMVAAVSSAILLGLIGTASIGFLAWHYQTLYDARLEVEAPSRMLPNSVKPISFTVENKGSKAWRQGKRYYAVGLRDDVTYSRSEFKLLSKQNMPNDSVDRLELPASGKERSIPASEKLRLAANLRAPSKPGTYWLTWQIVREGVAWFGEARRTKVIVVE